eukprot:COSAG04_NODE_1893_length_5290_cov_1.894433_6_plen_103_part_00
MRFAAMKEFPNGDDEDALRCARECTGDANDPHGDFANDPRCPDECKEAQSLGRAEGPTNNTDINGVAFPAFDTFSSNAASTAPSTKHFSRQACPLSRCLKFS